MAETDDGERWRTEMAERGSGERWWRQMAERHGGQTWRREMAEKLSIDTCGVGGVQVGLYYSAVVLFSLLNITSCYIQKT